MRWGLAATVLPAALALAGCSPSRCASVEPAQTTAGQACTATMERLRNERLPALVSVEPWENRYGPGLKLTTDHYEIFSTLTEPLMLRTIPGFLESAYRGYNDQLPQPLATASPFQVYLFADREQWEDFTREFAGEQAALFCKIKAGAYYLNGVCVVYDIGPKRTLSALGHEGWHQFNSRHFRYRLPSWLDEGVAMQFETGVSEGGLFRFDPAANFQRLGALQETLRAGKPLPLRELVSTSPGEVLATNEDQAVMAFYSQSYALIRFLHEAGYGQRLGAYRRLLSDGLLGRWPLDEAAGTTAADRNLPRTLVWNRQVGRQLFEHYIGPDLDRLEQEYLAFCHRITRGLVRHFATPETIE
ncbi:MAG: hypothetical protein FJ280_15750 [Planctomycetes bacterium]|nr:hypothetical protein [Planctomycetota bacterium]